MSDRRGIFSLEEFYDLQVSGETSTISDTFIYVTSVNPAQTAGPAMGYWAGGNGSVVDRVDFSNDTPTASARGNLSVSTRSGLGNGGSTPSYGYAFAGSPGPKSSVDRVDYASDTSTASPKGPLSYARSQHSTITNTNYGYTGGGWPGPYSTIDRLDYANDTATATSLGNIMVPSGRDYATTGNQSYGYLLGGYDPSLPQYRSTVRRIDYSNDTATTSPRGSLRDICGDNSATGNANYGFIKGGGNATRGPIEVLDFANDTATPATTTQNILTVGAYNRGATGNADYGWFGGGDPPNRSYVDRIDYSNYTAAAVTKGPLTVARGSMATFSAREHGLPQTTSTKNFTPATRTETHNPQGTDYGYNGGGYTPAAPNRISLVDRIDYSNDTATAAVKGPLSVGRNGVSGTSNVNYGYMAGGIRNSPTGDVTLVDRIDYGNDTATASPKGNLSATRLNGCPVGNNNYGYIAGGRVGGTSNSTSIDRIDYSSDTSTALVKGPTTVGDSFYQAGTGNQSSGYITSGKSNGGGTTQGTTIQKIDYSNDTATASPKGNLEHAMSRTAAAGNSNYGYVGGGQDSGSRTYMQRIDYSSDTGTTSPKGPLVLAKYVHSAASSTTHGYFSAGKSPAAPGTGWSNTDRIDYSNDTATAVDKSPLSAARAYHAGTSSRDYGNPTGVQTVDKGAAGYKTTSFGPAYGYFAGGRPQPMSKVQRVDYANDTATASPKGNMAVDINRGGGQGNITQGYTFGGESPSSRVSSVYKVDYANDTATAGAKGPLSSVGNYCASIGNSNYGYTGGRYDGTPYPNLYSSLDRLDYANDTAAATAISAGMTPGSYNYTTVGNQSYGYFIGGYEPPLYRNNLRRLDYASDTTALAQKGPMRTNTTNGAAAGNANYGWVNLNFNPSSYIDRIDYANDTATPAPKGNLSSGNAYNRAATGSSEYGYFVGGGWPLLSTVDRIDYSNDTATPAPKGPINDALTQMQAFSARDYGLQNLNYIPRIRWFDVKEETDEIPGTPSGTPYGYLTGGSGGQSNVDRIDFDNDTATASPRGKIASPHYRGGGAGSMTHGYSFGGVGYSHVSRIDYSNDTGTTPARGKLCTPADYCSSVGTNDYGYTGGRAWSYYYVTGKVDYSNDTATETLLNPSGFGPSPSTYGYGAMGNRSYGYFVGGSGKSLVRRLDYSNDTAAIDLKGPLTGSGAYCSATGNADYGYAAVSPSWSSNSMICRIDYANDTANASPKGPLGGAAGYRTATGNANYGYWAGGTPSTEGGTKIYRVDYANDTGTAGPKGNLSVSNYRQQGMSSREYGNPNTPGPVTPAFKAPVQPPFPFPVQAHNPGGYGYWSGGYNYNVGGDTTSVERINFTNDTATALVRGNITSPGQFQSASSNKSYGYLAGGNAVPTKSHVQRVDYANDSQAAAPKGPLTFARGSTAGAGNNDYGWHAGGIYSLPNPRLVYSSVDRIDYANDSSTASPKGPLASARGYHQAAGNLNYGYFAAGSPSGVFGPVSSTVQRIDYSNDSTTASPKGPLSRTTSQFAATGNANYGYFIAGYPQKSTIDRIDYSSDTGTASTKGPLYRTAYRTDATGNPNYGYVHSGMSPSTWTSGSTEIARIDYSNDTATTAIKGTFVNSKALSGAAFSAVDNGRS